MKRLTSIVAMNLQGAIGANNALPWRLKTDMRFFKQETIGNVAIMGRKTFESLGSKPLPQRCNIVLSHSYNLFSETPDCVAAFGIEEGLLRADRAAGKRKECFVIGGASMYQQFAPYVDRYLITLVNKAVPDADTFIDLDFLKNADRWDRKLVGAHPADRDNEADFEIWECVSTRTAEISEERDRAVARQPLSPRRSNLTRASQATIKPESALPAYLF